MSAGDSSSEAWLGREVIIDPAFNWGPNPRVQGEGFNLLGMPTDGTYAEFVRVPAASLHVKPAHLSFEEAAAVPLASVTAYRAVVTRGRVQAGEMVVITGIGGGVALAALSIPVRLGAHVFVTSGSDRKLAAARSHGAAGGVNHTNADWVRILIDQAGRRPDVVIDGAGGDTFEQALELVAAGGRVVSYGATCGPSHNVTVRRIFWKQLDVLGATMGTPDDFRQMVELYSDGLRPLIDSVFPLADAAKAHRRMEEGAQFGKIVLRIADQRTSS